MKAQKFYFFFNFSSVWGWVVNVKFRPLYPPPPGMTRYQMYWTLLINVCLLQLTWPGKARQRTILVTGRSWSVSPRCSTKLCTYFQTIDGLLQNVIGLDLSGIPRNYTDQLFGLDIFSSLEGVTMIPSAVMALLTGRLGILWLLNVVCLICVPASIPRLTNKKGRVSVWHNTVGGLSNLHPLHIRFDILSSILKICVPHSPNTLVPI